MQWDSESKSWQHFAPEESFVTDVVHADNKVLLGYDVVTFTTGSQADVHRFLATLWQPRFL